MIEALLAFLAGLLAGSFLNVCIFRLPRDLSVVNPVRSFCPTCEHTIAWYDNIPLVSYVTLGARCRNCGTLISWRYPLVEFLTGLVFFVCVYAFGVTPAAAKWSVFGSILITLIFSDLEERILPDEFTLGGAAAGVLFAIFVRFQGGLMQIFLADYDPRVQSVGESLFAALFVSGSIWIVGELYYRVRKREGLGFGDVKMVAMIGAFLGLQGVLLTLILGSLLGGVGGLIYIFVTGKDASTYELPFGTFLGLSAATVTAFGEPVLRWYLRVGS